MVLGEEVEVDFVAYGCFDAVRAVGETILSNGDGVRCRIGQQWGKGQGEGGLAVHCSGVFLFVDLAW